MTQVRFSAGGFKHLYSHLFGKRFHYIWIFVRWGETTPARKLWSVQKEGPYPSFIAKAMTQARNLSTFDTIFSGCRTFSDFQSFYGGNLMGFCVGVGYLVPGSDSRLHRCWNSPSTPHVRTMALNTSCPARWEVSWPTGTWSRCPTPEKSCKLKTIMPRPDKIEGPRAGSWVGWVLVSLGFSWVWLCGYVSWPMWFVWLVAFWQLLNLMA